MRLITQLKKQIPKASIICLSLFTLACSHTEETISKPQIKVPSLVIDNINIIDVNNERVIPNQQIIIREGIISAIRPAQKPIYDKSIVVKDGKGGFIMPGLIDMHVHAYDKSAFELSLSHGVTHVRVMNGVPQHVKWRNEQNAGKWLASGMTISSPIIRAGDSQPLSWIANTEQQARELVQTAKREGYDLIKAYGSLSEESLLAILDESKKLSMPVAKHGPHPAEGMQWQDLKGLQSLEHVEDIYQGPLAYTYNDEKLQQTIKHLSQIESAVTPTLNIFWQLTQISKNKQKFIDGLPQDYISPIIAWEDKKNQVSRWLNSSAKMSEHNQKTLDFLSKVIFELQNKNIPILVGSDAGVLLSPHGLATHNELKLLKQSGLSTFSVLRSATILPAKVLKKENEIGQIKVGLKADFILTNSDPTQDLSYLQAPHAIIKGGHWLDKDELKQLRKHAIEQQSWWSEFKVLLSNY